MKLVYLFCDLKFSNSYASLLIAQNYQFKIFNENFSSLIEAILTRKPDALVIDFDFLEFEAKQLIEVLKNDEFKSFFNMPICAIKSTITPSDLGWFKENTLNCVLNKPFNMQTFIQSLDSKLSVTHVQKEAKLPLKRFTKTSLGEQKQASKDLWMV